MTDSYSAEWERGWDPGSNPGGAMIYRKVYIECIINNYTMGIQTKTRIRGWGNSFGVVIPRELVIREGFKVNDRVNIRIDKKQNLEEFFGKGKGRIKDVQKEKNEARKLWKMK